MTAEERLLYAVAYGCAVVIEQDRITVHLPKFLADLVLSDGRTFAHHREEWDTLGTKVICEMDKQSTEPVADWLPALFEQP